MGQSFVSFPVVRIYLGRRPRVLQTLAVPRGHSQSICARLRASATVSTLSSNSWGSTIVRSKANTHVDLEPAKSGPPKE